VEGLESMDLRLHSQSTRHKALGEILMWKGGTSIWCNFNSTMKSLWNSWQLVRLALFVQDIYLVINSTHEFLFCVSFIVSVCGVFSGISLNILFILGSAHNHLAQILSLKIQVMCMDIVQSHFLQNFMASLNSWVISSSQE